MEFDWDLQDAYEYMYYELMENQLEVILVPSQDPNVARSGGMIRAVVHRNPEWYRALCAVNEVPSKRKNARTRIRRQNISRILKRLSEGKTSVSKYLCYLEEEARRIKDEYSDIQFYNEFGIFPEPWKDQF